MSLQGGPLLLETLQRGIVPGQVIGLDFVEAGRILRRHERKERRRSLLHLASGKGPLRTLENAVERVIIRGRHRIILVVVATGAPERQSQNGTPHGIDRIREIEMLVIGGRRIAIALTDREEPGRRDAVRIAIGSPFGGQDVSRDLFAQELIERLVGIEGPDHPIPV